MDRQRYIKVADLPYETKRAIIDSSNQIYAFNPTTKTIEKLSLDLSLPVQAYPVIDNRIELSFDVTDMVYSETSGQLLAVSQETNQLLKINGSDLTVSVDSWIGSMPSDLVLHGGSAYASLYGSTQIAVTQEGLGAAISQIELAQNPHRIAVGADKIYYLPEFPGSGGRYLYVYDRNTGATGKVSYSNVPYKTFYRAELYLDEASNTLYIGESALSSSYLYAITPSGASTYSVTALTPGYSYPRAGMIRDGDNFYYAQRRFAYPSITQEFLYPEHVVYAKNGYVFTPNKAFIGDTEQFVLPFAVDHAAITDTGVVFLHNTNKSGIYRYDSFDEIKVPRAVASSLSFVDTNSAAGKLNGTFTFKGDPDQSYITGYKAYFLDSAGQKLGDAFETIVKASSRSYSIAISELSVPQKAVSIAIYSYNQYAESTKRTVAALNDLFLDGTFVDTNANAGRLTGTIHWSRLIGEAGVTYRIHATDSTYQAELGSVGETEKTQFSLHDYALPPNASHLIIRSVDASGTPYNTMRVIPLHDLTSANEAPVDTEVDTDKEPDNSDGSGDGTSGGSNGDSNGTDGGGRIVLVKDASGRLTAKTQYSLSQLMDRIERHMKSGTEEKMSLYVNADADAVSIELPTGSISEMVQARANSELEIVTNVGTLAIPVKTVTAALQQLGIDVTKAQMTVAIAKADQRTAEQIDAFVTSIGANPVLTPVDFSLSVTTEDGITHTLSDFTSFIGRTLEWETDGDEVSFANLTGVAYDPNTNSYFPVPTLFVEENGTIKATLYRQGFSYYTVIKHDVAFQDIAEKHYAKSAIETLASKLIVTGYQDGSYQTGKRITRAEFAELLTRALGLTPKPENGVKFNDVNADDWFADSVGAAVKAGLVQGYSDNTFKANQTITRQEMAVMIAKALALGGYDADEQAISGQVPSFGDLGSIAAWAKDDVRYVAEAGIIQGTIDGNIEPNAPADRAQSAMMLYRMLKVLKFIN
jgi:hypothetical protein